MKSQFSASELDSTEPTRRQRIYIICATIFYCCAVTALILLHRVDIISWDAWGFVKHVAAFLQGSYDWKQLFVLHNGHMIAIPKLIMLFNAWLTHWNTLYEHLFSLSMSWLLLALFVRYFRSIQAPVWSFLGIGVITFNLMQSMSWIWGWQLQIFLSVTASCYSLYFLHQQGTKNTLLGLLFLLIASFSFGSGILTAYAGVVLLRDRPKTLTLWCVGTIIFTIIIAMIFLNTNTQINHDSLLNLLLLAVKSSPIIIFYSAFALGSFWVQDMGHLATAIGLTFLIFTFWQLIQFHRNPTLNQEKALPLSLAVFSLLTAAFITMFRSFGNLEIGASPRYMTLYIPFWLAQLLLITSTANIKRLPRLAWIPAGLFALFIVFASNYKGYKLLLKTQERYQNGLDAVLMDNKDTRAYKAAMMRLCWAGCESYVKEQLPLLKKHKLLIYREK